MAKNLKLTVLLFGCFGLALRFPLVSQTLASAHPPRYPLAAKAAGIDGPVVLKGTISKEGKLQNIHVLSGPPELQQAAIEAVQDWTYKPYKHFGRVVEVDTTVTVNFKMGSGEKKAAEQATAQAEIKAGQQKPAQETLPSTTPQP